MAFVAGLKPPNGAQVTLFSAVVPVVPANGLAPAGPFQMGDTMQNVLEDIVTATEAAGVSAPPADDREIELRAYFRYLDRGRVDGAALDDWLAAEAELRAEHDDTPPA